MSVRVMADVYDNGPDDPTQNAVLLCLANSADDAGGNCFPGTELIARRTRYSVRTVIRAIAALEADGWIEVLQRGGGRPKQGAKWEQAAYKSQYQLNVKRLHDGIKPCQSVTVLEKRGGPAETVTLRPKKGDTVPKKGDFDDNPPHPLFGVSIPDPSMEPTPPNPPGGVCGGDGLDDVPLNEEQVAHVATLPESERGTWARWYREENQRVAEQAAEVAREQAARALEIGELKRAMPTVAAAVAWVMRKCVFVQTRKGRGLEVVIELAIRNDRREPWEAAEALARTWLRYKANLPKMRLHYGPLKFIETGMWTDEAGWPWDRERLRLESVASAGRL